MTPPRLPQPLADKFDHLRSLPGRQLSKLLASRRGASLRTQELWLTNRSGYRIEACLHEPDDAVMRPGVLLVPGANESGRSFCGFGGIIAADELATLGLRVLHFAPVGRGRSWGHDDYCGLQGQDSCRAALECLHSARGVDPDRVVVVAFSLGLALAAPVLAEHGERLGTHALIDWEGTPKRAAMEALGALPPAAEAARQEDPERFWALRDPEAVLDKLPCQHIPLRGGGRRAESNRLLRGQLRDLLEL